jgi:D-proline reductase (dithiol) PrdB
MSRLGDFSSSLRALAGTERSRRDGSEPWTPLRKPLSDCTLAIVTGSAYVDAAPQLDRPGVELCGFRSFSQEALAPAPAAEQSAGQAPDPSRFEADRLGVTVGRARELVAHGRVARLAPGHLTLTGAVDSRDRLVRRAREAASALTGGEVDVVLLVPM